MNPIDELDYITGNAYIFRNLYDYIQTADVNNHGILYVGGTCFIQIHSNKKQVDICKDNRSIGNIIFDIENNQVQLVRVENGIADYNNPMYIGMDNPIPATDPGEAGNGWYMHFGSHGREIKSILIFLLN